jgi:hypothetical protein
MRVTILHRSGGIRAGDKPNPPTPLPAAGRGKGDSPRRKNATPLAVAANRLSHPDWGGQEWPSRPRSCSDRGMSKPTTANPVLADLCADFWPTAWLLAGPAPTPDPSGAAWATTEFAAAALGNARRPARLWALATTLAQAPSAALPQACEDAAALEAAYRFFANPAITPAAILASHVAATTTRAAAYPLVLVPQDTTDLNYTSHPATTDLGPLPGAHQRGLLVHTSLAFTPQRLPLGVLAQASWTRDPAQTGKRQQRRSLPLAEKESQKWLSSLAAVTTARQAAPPPQFVSIGDREADVYDLFIAARPPGVDLLVRAAWDRRTELPERHLWASLATAVQTSWLLSVPRHAGQPARWARVTVRWAAVTLLPPAQRAQEHLPAVQLWAVLAVEEAPPDGVAGVEWLLLTTCPVESVEAAEERLDWYGVRWGNEIGHKVLKSGCRIEARQLGTAAGLSRAVAVYSVVAWRLFYLTWLARVAPELPASAVLTADEWHALTCRMTGEVPGVGEVPTVGQATAWIARLGGYLGRKGDGPPGPMVLWRGYQRLRDLARMYRILRGPPPLSDVIND